MALISQISIQFSTTVIGRGYGSESCSKGSDRVTVTKTDPSLLVWVLQQVV